MSDPLLSDPLPTAFQVLGATITAGLAGFLGMVVGVKVHGAEIASIKERLDRMEAKIDRLIERGHNN